MHRPRRRCVRWPSALAIAQRLPAVAADAARQGGVHDRIAGDSNKAPPGAASDGRLPWFAVRLLHARFRDVARRPAADRTRGRRARDRRRLIRQPVPLHRLPPDHRRGPAHVPTRRATGNRLAAAARLASASRGWRSGADRAAHGHRRARQPAGDARIGRIRSTTKPRRVRHAHRRHAGGHPAGGWHRCRPVDHQAVPRPAAPARPDARD